jgi:hypothetical protein
MVLMGLGAEGHPYRAPLIKVSARAAVISNEIDLRISCFKMGEIDGAFEGAGNDEEDDLPALNETVTQLGDPLAARRASHPLRRCPDVRELRPASRRRAGPMVFTDPPWNIPIAGHVSGLGAIKHGDFAMGCGEMSAAEFEAFPTPPDRSNFARGRSN